MHGRNLRIRPNQAFPARTHRNHPLPLVRSNRVRIRDGLLPPRLPYGAWAADDMLKQSVRASEGAFLCDETFVRSSHWELSTSQLSSPFFDGWGYGEVVPDGYGLSYAIGDEYIRWTITSIKRRTEAFKHYLAEAATEIRDMMEAAKKADAEQQGKL
ncbi:hypothetical protein C0992_002501 [Termitomyces sp. T32_za158]|nr:hypothetical protein C0992_002501 [Termitomyces sp. T32_za158]